MRILKWVTDNGLEAVISPWGIIIPFIAITIILCSCGSGSKEYKPIVIKNSHGQSTVIFTSSSMGGTRSVREKAIAWIEDNTDKKIVSVSFDWHGAMSVIVYEVGDTKKCKECGQPMPEEIR
jgi:ABC-type glycerol-3-phosphate transport system substrate-binding protein